MFVEVCCNLPEKKKKKAAPRSRAHAPYVISRWFRVNMAASMASQAAARGLRAATSKHALLDKLKVLSRVTPPSMCWRLVRVSLGLQRVRCCFLRELLA